MKIPSRSRLVLTAAAFATTALLLPASAQARGHSTTVHGARGGVYERNVSRTPGNVSASETAKLPDGRTASRSVQSSATCTGRTTTAQATGFNGRSTSYSSTRTDNPDGFTRQASATGPNGATATKTVEVVHQDGTTTRTVAKTTTPPKSSP